MNEMAPALPPVNVLLVDDQPQNLLALEAVLGDLDLRLVTASSGAAALGCLLKDDFAVILLDVYMPGLDGLETAALIGERERSRDTPIIFLTAAGRGDDLVARGYQQGAVDYIVKPINPAILRSKVAVFVELYRKRAQVTRQAAQLAGLNAQLEERVRERTVELEHTVKDLQQQIAERQRVEAERAALLLREQAARHEAEQAVRIRDDFLSIASHELKTPITALHAALQTLERATRQGLGGDLVPERVQRLLEIIDLQDKRLIKLVNDLLDVSRISAGRLQLELEEVDLTAIVDDVVERFHEEIVLSGCPLQVEAAGPVIGLWDGSRLEQIVTNLLTNALKYGAGQPVTIALSADATTARLVVTDGGIGIAAEHLERIFGRFERVASPNHYGGVGLGLYIVHEIVAALGGTVGVVSAPGQGATFTVALPLRVGAAQSSPTRALSR